LVFVGDVSGENDGNESVYGVDLRLLRCGLVLEGISVTSCGVFLFIVSLVGGGVFFVVVFNSIVGLTFVGLSDFDSGSHSFSVSVTASLSDVTASL
jgi:hypothetical protein